MSIHETCQGAALNTEDKGEERRGEGVYQSLFCMSRAHPFSKLWGRVCQRRVKAIQVPIQWAKVAGDDFLLSQGRCPTFVTKYSLSILVLGSVVIKLFYETSAPTIWNQYCHQKQREESPTWRAYCPEVPYTLHLRQTEPLGSRFLYVPAG